jgi:hypothetical protein
MSYKEYTVRVYDDGDVFWCKPGTVISHREDGPAIIRPMWFGMIGHKEWYIDGKKMSEEEFNNRNKSSCDGKVVEIDGKKYQLKEV